MAETTLLEPPRLEIDDEHDDEAGAVLPRRPAYDPGDMDITPMIDMTFLLLIFFLVCSTMAMESDIELPEAEFGTGVSMESSTLITLASRENAPAEVWLGQAAVGTLLPDDPVQQEEQITAAVEAGLQQGKSNVVVKAERDVKHHEVSRVSSAVGNVEGVKLYMGVVEMQGEGD